MTLTIRTIMSAFARSPEVVLSLPAFPEGAPQAQRKAPTRPFALELPGARVTFTAGGDLGLVFWHRYLLIYYLGYAGPVFPAFLLIGPRTSRDSEHMPSVMVGIVAMLFTLELYVRALRWWGTRKAALSEVMQTISLTPGMLIGVAVLMAVSLVYGLVQGELWGWTTTRYSLLYATLVIYAHVVAAVILRKVVPRAVGELHLRAARFRAAALVDVQRAAASEEKTKAEPEDPVPAVLQGVLRLEAQGNHVLVVTERGRHLLPGPFGAMVARLPPDLGRQVHRSHWVACRAVLGTQRQGRDVVIETVDGARVPVASSKFGTLRGWLAAAGRHRSAAAEAGQSGAGA